MRSVAEGLRKIPAVQRVLSGDRLELADDIECRVCDGRIRYWSGLSRQMETCMTCWRQSAWAYIVRKLGGSVADASFENSVADGPAAKRIRVARDRWYKTGWPQGRGLFLGGSPGIGKTWLAAACCRQIIDTATKPVSFEAWVYTRWASRISDAMQCREFLTAAQMQDRAEKCALLVFDDWGYEELPKYMVDQVDGLFQSILKTRYEAQRAVIITTNRSIQDIVLDDRYAALVSRMRGGWLGVLDGSGEDLRRI